MTFSVFLTKCQISMSYSMTFQKLTFLFWFRLSIILIGSDLHNPEMLPNMDLEILFQIMKTSELKRKNFEIVEKVTLALL